MTESAKALKCEYQRKYYQSHKEQFREYNKRSWEKKATAERQKSENNGNNNNHDAESK